MADFKRAKDEAKRLINEHHIFHPPVFPEKIAESLGVPVKFVRFDGAAALEVSGFYDVDDSVIYINSDESPSRMRYTIAHELGHIVLHEHYLKSENYQIVRRDSRHAGLEKSDIEKEADVFAANLLVPLNFLERYSSVATPRELANIFLVSEVVIANRLKDLRHW